jgi:acetyl esterase
MKTDRLKYLTRILAKGRPDGFDPLLHLFLKMGRATKKDAYFNSLDPIQERQRIARGAGSIVRLRGGATGNQGRTWTISVSDASTVGPNGVIPLRTYSPPNPEETIVFLHGGGWVVGSMDDADFLCRCLAQRLSSTVVSVGYHLAPEHPFPAALDDLTAVLGWARSHGAELACASDAVSVAGSSAGANIAAASCLKARDDGLALPSRQLLLYPVTDITSFDTRSYRALEGAPVGLTRAEMEWFARNYLGGEAAQTADAEDPYVSPLKAPSLSGLPPAVIVTAEFDVLRDEGEEYGRRLTSAGSDVRIMRAAGMSHGFLNLLDIIPSVNEWFDRIAVGYTSLRESTGDDHDRT